jgi:hypothetical protein
MPWTPSRLTKSQLEEHRTRAFEMLDVGGERAQSRDEGRLKRSRLLFQKCTNYELRLAMVLLEPALHGERFSELIHEHRTHKLIQFFVSIDEAKTWLSVQ